MPKRLTNAEWIMKAKEVHGNRYDYSLVDYRNSKTKVRITCRHHGVWEANPSLHISHKRGCPECGGSRKKTTEEFAREASEVHGGKYDYSESQYINSHKKLVIKCPTHGAFQQSPTAHLSGQGCRECGTTAHFHTVRMESINSIQAALTEKSDGMVSLVPETFVNINEKADFVCKKHGRANRLVNSVINGVHSCLDCYKEIGGILKYTRSDIDQVLATKLEKTITILPFEFSTVNDTDIRLECPIHGIYEVKLKTILNNDRGGRCWQCSMVDSSQTRKQAVATAYEGKRKEFWDNYLTAFRQMHGNKFDYSKSNYIDAKTPIEIICPEHGSFYQPPDSHRIGGCKSCANEELAGLYSARFFELRPELKNEAALFYLLKLSWNGESCYKFGITRNSLKRRFGMALAKGIKVEVLGVHETTLYDAWRTEVKCLGLEGVDRYELNDKEFARQARISPTELFSELPENWISLVKWTQTEPYIL